MAENYVAIANYLAADATLVGTLTAGGYTGILQGGLWTRPLKRQGLGATPTAFWVGSKGASIRPSAVIVDAPEDQHPQAQAIPTAYNQRLSIFLYGPVTQTGKDAVHAARRRIFALLDYETSGWTFTTADGTHAFVLYDSRTGVRDSEEFPGTVMDLVRYELRSRYANRI